MVGEHIVVLGATAATRNGITVLDPKDSGLVRIYNSLSTASKVPFAISTNFILDFVVGAGVVFGQGTNLSE
jgi:hypothetical protein